MRDNILHLLHMEKARVTNCYKFNEVNQNINVITV